MNRIIKSIAISAVLLLAMNGLANAGPIFLEINPDSGSVLDDAAASSGVFATKPFSVPYARPLVIAVFCDDSSYQENTDSLKFVLQKGVDYQSVTSDGFTHNSNANWRTIFTSSLIRSGSTLPGIWTFEADSIDLGVYPVGGTMRVALIDGGTAAAAPDTIDGVWKFDIFIETAPPMKKD